MVYQLGVVLQLIDDLRALARQQRSLGGLDQQPSHFGARRTVGAHGRVPHDLVVALGRYHPRHLQARHTHKN